MTHAIVPARNAHDAETCSRQLAERVDTCHAPRASGAPTAPRALSRAIRSEPELIPGSAAD